MTPPAASAPVTSPTTFGPPALGANGPSAAKLQGVNWATPTDNFSNRPLILTGLSPSDAPATVWDEATTILRQLRDTYHVSTVRLPINPATVLNPTETGPGPWWKSYREAIDAATNLEMNVILSYWNPTTQVSTPTGRKDLGSWPGTIEDVNPPWPTLGCPRPRSGAPYFAFDEMWDQVISQYAGESRVYFEIMNEPWGYDPWTWTDLAVQWLHCYPQVPRSRVIVSAAYRRTAGCMGMQNDLGEVGTDPRLNGTLLSLHYYTYNCKAPSGHQLNDAKDLAKLLQGVSPGRVVIDAFGTNVTYTKNEPPARNPDFSDPSSIDSNVQYMRQLTAELKQLGMGAVYWPGIKGCVPLVSHCDSFSIFSLDGSYNLLPRGNRTILRLLEPLWESGSEAPARVGTQRRAKQRGSRRLVDIAMDRVDQVFAVRPIVLGQVLGDRDRAVPATGAPDPDHQMRLALGEILRQQIVEQREQMLVKSVKRPVGVDERDDPVVKSGQRA
jgi:hypothetical protein